MVEDLLLRPEIIWALDERERVRPHLEQHLRPRLVAIRLAQDLPFVRHQLGPHRPRAVDHILLHKCPRPPVIARILRLDVALSEVLAIPVAQPEEGVRLGLESEDEDVERGRRGRRRARVPRAAPVHGEVEFLGFGEEVRAAGVEFVDIELGKVLLRIQLRPRVTFVSRLPKGVIDEENEDGLQH